MDWLVLRAHQLHTWGWEVTLYNAHVEHKYGTGRTFAEAHADALAAPATSAEYTPPPIDAPVVDLRTLPSLASLGAGAFTRRF